MKYGCMSINNSVSCMSPVYVHDTVLETSTSISSFDFMCFCRLTNLKLRNYMYTFFVATGIQCTVYDLCNILTSVNDMY